MKSYLYRNIGLLLAISGTVVAAGAPACAAARDDAAPAPSSNAMVNLIRLLEAQGTISRDKGDELIAEAEREAAQARATMAAALEVQQGNSQLVAAQGGMGNLAPPAPGTIRVPYIPETVREQIRDEIKADVLKQAAAQGWASPGKAAPDWVRNFRFYGDLRIRSQTQLYNRFNSDQVPNFQAIAASGPLDLINAQIPLLNTTANKYNLTRMRFRLGADITVNSKVKVGIEMASGNDASPVSATTTLAGGFFKRNLYLNKAYVMARATDHVTVVAGRMDNPFLSTDVLFDPDLKFDGFAAEAKMPMDFLGLQAIKLRGGVFPLDFGGQNFPDTASSKTTSPQKWLFSGQIESDFSLPHDSQLKLAAAYHAFTNVQGRPSAPCALYLGVTQCSTDQTAPFFLQKGNTLSFIRRIVLDPTLPSSTVQAQPQLVGLTMPFRVLDLMASFKMPVGKDREFSLVGDYVRNLAFKPSYVCRYGLAGQPINNGGSGGSGNICDTTVANRTPYVGGKQGFQILASFGHPNPRGWGEWKALAGYKYLGSDAVLDSFNDDDFHLGGTNAKGFFLGGTLGLRQGVTLGTRWLSANEVSGEPLAIDVLQIDLGVSF
jgi:hypothetical protein